MQRCLLFLLAGLLYTAVLRADYPGWENYTSGLAVNDIATTADAVWMATRGGVARLGRNTESMQWYNRTNSGLPANDVRSVVVDKAGTVWFGTMNDGLASFDGTTWRTFTTRNSDLLSGSVRQLATDGNTIWAGTWGGGLARFDGSNWTVYTSEETELPNNYISTLYVDRQGTLWVGTENTGLTTFDGTTWSRFDDQGNIPFPTVACLTQGSDGAFWFGTGNYTGSGGGAAQWHNGAWSVFTTANSGLPGNTVSSIHTDSQGAAWFATNNGLVLLDDTQWLPYPTAPYGLPSTSISVVTGDESHLLWVGTRDKGMARITDGGAKVYNPSNSGLPGNSIADMETDAQGGVWIAVPGGGLVYTREQDVWHTYTTDNAALPDNRAYDIVLDRDGVLWCATYGGVARFDGTDWQAYTPSNAGLPTAPITCVAADRNGDIWAGTYGAGILRFNGATWHRYTTADGLPSVYVTSIAVDSSNNVWAANFTDGSITGYGAVRFDGSNWTPYTDLPNPSVAEIAVDATGVVWIGTEAGAVRLEGKERQEFTVFNSGLPDHALRALSVTPDGAVWFGTLNGSTRFDGTDWTHYSTGNSGLPHNFTGRVVLRNGNTWIATSGGIGVLLAPVTSVRETLPRQSGQPAPRLLVTRHTLVLAFPDGLAGLPVTLRIFDLFGREAAAPYSLSALPGVRELSLTTPPAGGLYLYHLQVGGNMYTGTFLYHP